MESLKNIIHFINYSRYCATHKRIREHGLPKRDSAVIASYDQQRIRPCCHIYCRSHIIGMYSTYRECSGKVNSIALWHIGNLAIVRMIWGSQNCAHGKEFLPLQSCLSVRWGTARKSADGCTWNKVACHTCSLVGCDTVEMEVEMGFAKLFKVWMTAGDPFETQVIKPCGFDEFLPKA